MTQDRVTRIDAAISDVIGSRIRDLRESAGLSREDLAVAAREAGAPASLTGTVIRFLETGRPDKDGRRTRYFAFDELLGVAAGLEVSPLELLGDQAVHFAGEQVAATTSCANCGATPGPVETTVRTDLAQLAAAELEPSLAQIAYGLARAVDVAALAGDGALPRLTRELRACLEQIAAGRRGHVDPDPDAEDELDGLDEPD